MTTRRYQVEADHPRRCRVDLLVPGERCNWVRVHLDPNLCSKHLGQWRRSTLGRPANAYRHKNDRNWLPDDGVFDPLAVEIAALGLRVVRMTDAERLAAAKRILAHGGDSGTIMERVGITRSQAVKLMMRARETGIAESLASLSTSKRDRRTQMSSITDHADDMEMSDAFTVNKLLAMGPALGTFLATLAFRQRSVAVLLLFEALAFSEDVYTALLFRPQNVVMVELEEAEFSRTFVAGADGVQVDDGEPVIDPRNYPKF